MYDTTPDHRPLFLAITCFLLYAQLFMGLPVVKAAPSVVTTIAVSGYPIDAGVNPVTNRIYVAKTIQDSVAVINGSTNTVTETVPAGDAPYGVDVNPDTNTIYVANRDDNTVSVIDGSTNTVTATVAVGNYPVAIDVNPVTNRIYVVNEDANSVSVINGANNTVTATVPVGSHPTGIAVNPATNLIYVANRNSNNVSVINGSTNTVTATVAVGDGPEGIDVNPVTNRIYVANQWQYTVSVIDGSTNTVTATVTLANMNNQGVGVNPATNRIYVSSFYNGRVNVIDGSSNTVIANLGVGSGSWGVGVNPDTCHIYVGKSSSNSVSVIYDPFIITASASSGGSISPSGQVGVNPGEDRSFIITPDAGNHITQVFADGFYQGTPTSYTFSDVVSDHTISAHFALNTYTISTSVSGGHGSIQGTQVVNHGSSTSVTITPDNGYHIASITDNSTPQAVANPYVINNITANHNVVVTFAINTYDVNASVYFTGHGSVAPESQTVNYGADATIDIIPDAGYYISYITDNGATVAIADPYVISGVSADHNIVVTFAISTFSVDASVDGDHGSIDPVTQTVDYGTDAVIDIIPDAGYQIATITDNGASQPVADPYVISNVTANHNVVVTFAINTFSVDASVDGGHGSIDPASQTVNSGTDAVIDIIPDIGYHIASINDNGKWRDITDPYLISGVTANHTVVITFAIDTFSVDASVDGGYGSIDPVTQTVDYGTDAVIDIFPDTGYHIASITDNGAAKTIADPYVIYNITANHTVVVTFAIETFSVDAFVGRGQGSVDPVSQTAEYGADAVVNIIPDADYRISSIYDNGTRVDIANPYVIPGVTEDHTVTVNFARPAYVPYNLLLLYEETTPVSE
ncbi:MAG TPA: YncE family protein [Desulfobacteraceae bacterium]|nr:YncE family protein [Desulfobacteraceae bacterium]HPJ66886.1 YncE family protein [Desulfobacteraceae bacterium]HPQ27655.1 YncE family protein [Desulfobacteraceae bacterium]